VAPTSPLSSPQEEREQLELFGRWDDGLDLGAWMENPAPRHPGVSTEANRREEVNYGAREARHPAGFSLRAPFRMSLSPGD
jgi:hypothetical protein